MLTHFSNGLLYFKGRVFILDYDHSHDFPKSIVLWLYNFLFKLVYTSISGKVQTLYSGSRIFYVTNIIQNVIILKYIEKDYDIVEWYLLIII